MRMEAEEILAASIRGGVGYPAAENYDALQEVLETAKASALNTDALTEAMRHHTTDNTVPFAAQHAGDEIDEALLNDIDPDDLDVTDIDTRPDPAAYAEAMRHIIEGAPTRDITVGGTDADMISFLRANTAPEDEKRNAEAADREFLGIGYLFSEAEYEAIMAEFNADGSQNPVYDTDTQPFEALSDPDTKTTL